MIAVPTKLEKSPGLAAKHGNTNANGLWETAANWSSNPALPGPTDDVTINQPGAITVTLSTDNQSIRSIADQEALVINGATLTVGVGGGTIDGALSFSNGRLVSNNAGTLTINGALSPDSSFLQTSTGGVLAFPSTTSYSVGDLGSTIQANGAGSTINFSALTSFSGGTFVRTNVQALGGGLVNLSGATSITVGATDVTSNGTGSVVNLSALTTFSGDNFADGRRLRAENGGTITSPNLTTLGRVNVELVGASTIGLSGVNSANNASLFASGGGVIALPALTSYSVDGGGSTLNANGVGSVVNLSNVTSFSGGTFNRTNVQAQAGGLVNLSGATSITVGATDVTSNGTGSVVNLSALTTFSGDNFADGRRLRAENGGTITSPNLTTLGRVNVELVGASTIGLSGVNSANNASLFASGGGVIALPALTSYSVDGGGSTLNANGVGSVVNLSNVTSFSGGTFNRTNVQAQAGGLVNLSGATSITVGATDVTSNGTGSVVNLSALTTFSGDNLVDTRRLRAENGGAIQIRAAGPTTVSNAPVDMVTGGTITGNALNLSNNSTFNASGTLGASLINTSGVVTIDGAPGSLNITGNFTQAAGGTIRFEIGGTTPVTQFEQLNVTGSGTLNGILDVRLINGFVPAYSSTFDIITMAGVPTGGFEKITWTGSRPWRAQYLPGKVVLIGQFAGDFDEDGDVDGTDLGIWKVGFGTTSGAGHMQGDANGDHQVDGSDFLLWQRGAGGHVPILPASGAVPEPASLALLLIAAMAVLKSVHGPRTRRNPCLARRS